VESKLTPIYYTLQVLQPNPTLEMPVNGRLGNTTYEGRSINKLQNGAIALILKIWKIRNIRFVANLILNI